MENKIKRFLELSKEFTLDSNEVYEGFVGAPTHINFNYGTTGTASIAMYGSCVTQSSGTVDTTNLPTKAEQFETAQLEKIAKVKRYEEYLQLQTDLLEYYTAKEKLNN